MIHFEPQLHSVALLSLRPTQLTVGLREVEAKRALWRKKAVDAEKGADFLGRHMIPVVIGPGDEPWLIDHHHLARALLDEGLKNVLVSVIARLDGLGRREFLVFMENRAWLHPFDGKGRRCDPDDLPKKLTKLADDPWRALAAEVCRVGGFAKSPTPFAEFLWADFLRRRAKDDSDVETARLLALGRTARHLPGWCGPQ